MMATLTRRSFLAAPAAGLDIHSRVRRLASEAPLRLVFRGRTETDCRRWQRQFAAKLNELLGPHEPPREWKQTLERTVEAADHVREELLLEAPPHPPLPVYRLTPRASPSGRRAGIVALHGHGPFGPDPVVGIADTEERQRAIAQANYDYGLQLARRGYVVVAPCLTPFGRRLDDRRAYQGEDPCAVTFVRLQLLGKLLIAENLRDVLWSLALLERTPGVDPERLGCVGLSYGGRMTMLAAALEPRIRVAVISGALNVMQERIQGRYSCGALVIPGLLEFGDVPEIASLIAPRPCLWEAGRQDPLMVEGWLEAAFERIRCAYRACGAEHRLELERFDGGHRWNGVRAMALLDEVLRPA